MAPGASLNEEKYILRRYVAENTPQSATGYRNLKKLSDLHLVDFAVPALLPTDASPGKAAADVR